MAYEIVSVRENPQYLEAAIDYFSGKWSIPRALYDDCIRNSVITESPLPRWYLMLKRDDCLERAIGCYGLITNDFNSRQDLWPWLCALYVDENERGKSLGEVMLNHALKEAKTLGFGKVYLATDHIGYYEKYGWQHIATAYGIDGESRVYEQET